MKEGILAGALVALVLGGLLFGLRGAAEMIEAEGLAQAAALQADGQRAIDYAVSRQVDAATAAVQADTRAAHALARQVAPWSVMAVVVLVAVAVHLLLLFLQ